MVAHGTLLGMFDIANARRHYTRARTTYRYQINFVQSVKHSHGNSDNAKYGLLLGVKHKIQAISLCPKILVTVN